MASRRHLVYNNCKIDLGCELTVLLGIPNLLLDRTTHLSTPLTLLRQLLNDLGFDLN